VTDAGSGVGADHRARLEAERRRTADRLARLEEDHDGFVEASRDSNADDEHDPEGATIAFERSQVETLSREARRRLAEVDAALVLLAEGGYGTCTVCGRQIPAERLEVRPTARTCVGCAP
jgi:RNA polymerase-binding transcription factor DksA